MESTLEKKVSGSENAGIGSLSAYEVVSHEFLPDLDSDSWLLRHRKTGARVALLPKNDSNKVFYIAFRTPPEDSTGVAHIIEHTVLCGSKEFPIKDPFIELAKGSLNTFLNAMTYPDKTVYPVASCNEQDFKNLMHVYMDAVFYPNIYREQNIFRQEGWHYEAESADSEITVNGVVYNEMKGALSNAEDILGREISSALYPHTTYAYESGGDPVNIPDLTYEAYLDFHRRYYHPSNSYIYLYGDMDMTEKLEWIDREYLSHFDRLEIDSTIGIEPPFAAPVEAARVYSILPEEDPAGKSFLSWNVSVAPDSLDARLNMAIQILTYVLCDAEGAPVRRALRERGLGEDVYAYFESGIRQPSYSIVSKYTDPSRKDEFVKVIRDTLTELADKGLDRRALEAGINRYEFRYREADFGSYSRGLVYGLSALESWLYDDTKPFVGLTIGDWFDELRKEADRGYFEKIIRENLLDNPHCAVVVLEPVQGLSDRRDAQMRERMKKYADGLTPEEREKIVTDFKALREWQQTPDREEDILKIPMLRREDLTRKTVPLLNQVDQRGGVTVITHPQSTNHIDYMTLLFDIRDLPEKYIRLLGIFKTLFTVLDTEKHSYDSLGHEINIATGGLNGIVSGYKWFGDPAEDRGYRMTFEVTTKALHKNLKSAFELIREILLTTDYKMPDMSGIQTALQIRKLAGDVPVSLISAYDWNDIEEEAKAAGISSFIAKSLFKSTLYPALNGYGQEGASAQSEKKESERRMNLDGIRILLAEDQPLNADIATTILEDAGAHVQHAEDGLIATKMFQESPLGFFDVFLMDLRMSNMDGIGATLAIRSMPRADALTVPIIALTAGCLCRRRPALHGCRHERPYAKPIDAVLLTRTLARLSYNRGIGKVM